jgi:hypothetical protein
VRCEGVAASAVRGKAIAGTQKARRHQESKRRPQLGNAIPPKLFLFLSRKLKSERTMQRTFEADTWEEANRQADEWWSAAEGLRFIHRSQTPAGFRSNPAKRWVITIHCKEEAARRRLSDQSSDL